MRSPPIFSDTSVNPSFFRTTPAKKPRTECCCQPVAFMMAAIVAPLGWLSRARTASCLVGLRFAPATLSLFFTGFFARRLPDARLAFLEVLLCNILGSFHRLRRHQPPSPPKPRTGDTAGEAGSRNEAIHLVDPSHTTALLAPKCQFFLDNLIADC